MKLILLALALCGASDVPASAQGTLFAPDLDFAIDFYNAPMSIHGSASYYRDRFGKTNQLWLQVQVGPAAATGAAVLRLDGVGLETFAELTNQLHVVSSPPVGVPVDYYYYSPQFQLTIQQVYSLSADNWYVQVEVGGTNYLGILRQTSVGPLKPIITISPRMEDQISFIVIAANNRSATVTLDGSAFSDPFYMPVAYLWHGDGRILANASVTTQVLGLGDHDISLDLYDEISSGEARIVLAVLTPGQLLEMLISRLQSGELSPGLTGRMRTLLDMAKNSFNHGNMLGGAWLLGMFQAEVLHHTAPGDLRTALLETAQQVLDAVDS